MAKTEKKRMQITRERALKLFSYFNYKTAGKWSSKRMEGKLIKLPESVDINVVKNSKVEAILKEIINASSVEVVSADKEKTETKSTKKKATKKKTTTESVSKKKETKKKETKKKETKKTDKKKKKETKETGEKKKYKVLASVVEFIERYGPITKKALLKRMINRFPERNVSNMENNIAAISVYLIRTKGKSIVKENSEGKYYIKK